MKKILLAAMAGLSLTGCSTNFAPMTYAITLNVAGVPTANVVITDTTTGQPVFNQPVSGSAIVSDLPENHVFTVTGQDVAGFTTPASKTITLKSNATVSLIYSSK